MAFENKAGKYTEIKVNILGVFICPKILFSLFLLYLTLYGEYFKIYEDELKNVKRIVDGHRENTMKVTKQKMLKERLRTIGTKKDYSFSYVTKNMKNRSKIFETNYKRSLDKIEKIENTNFKKVTSAEIQKMINLCKNEQNIMK